MQADDAYPSYSFPKKILIQISVSLLRNKKRSIQLDSLQAISGIHPPIQIIGKENIPTKGPGMVTLTIILGLVFPYFG